MNETIRSLWNQAAASHSQADSSWQTQQNFLARFAELIALDCVNRVHSADCRSLTYTTYDQGLVEGTLARAEHSICRAYGLDHARLVSERARLRNLPRELHD